MSLATLDLSIIVPKEATNFITNPSYEIDTTGHAGHGGSSVARVTTQSRRGVASLEITPVANQLSGSVYTISLTSGVTYSFSCDVLDVAGQDFYIGIDDSGSGHTYASTHWTGNGYWKRRYLTFTAQATTAHYIHLYRSSVNSTTKFYTDGWQLEVGAVSTYIDGDCTGFVVGQQAYRWNGLRHASTSWRSPQTRAGGTYVHIGSTAVQILTILGLGMAPITNIGLPSTMGGSFFQNTIPNERPFSVIVNAHAQGDYAVIERAKTVLENAVKPDLTIYRQPLLLQCDQLDANGLEIAETLMIPCNYESGLEMDGDGDSYNEKFPVNFRMFMPMIMQDGEKGAVLGYQTSVANANYILKRGTDGAWAAMATGASDVVLTVASSPDGGIYAGGDFLNLGDIYGDRIAKWNGTAWSSLGTGANNTVYALAVGPDGSLYAGGLFTDLGSASGDYVAKWNGTAWSALGTGMNARVTALAVGPDGSLYAGGAFTSAGGVANTGYVAKWNGSTWVALGTGSWTATFIFALAFGPDGTLYAGGDFTDANGVANTGYVAKWNGTAWSALGTGMNSWVRALLIGPDGTLYAGGAFTSAGGVANTSRIAKWNGTAWAPMNTGMNDSVWSLVYGPDNMLYAGGLFTAAGGISLPDHISTWNGTAWSPLDVDLPGSSTIYTITFDQSGNLYIGYSTNGSATSATITVPSVGTATAYPRLVFTGPGTVYQLKNYMTGKAIFFNLTLNAGETAILDLDPVGVSFVSSFRGNIMNTILPGSNLDWELMPGANNVSCFIYGGTTAASGIVMTWRDQYWSIPGAVR
jgi:hypothetical protein